MQISINLSGSITIVDVTKETYQLEPFPTGLSSTCESEEYPGERDEFMDFSVNIPESSKLPKNQCYIKTWCINEGVLPQLEAQGVVKRLHKQIWCGVASTPAELVEILI